MLKNQEKCRSSIMPTEELGFYSRTRQPLTFSINSQNKNNFDGSDRENSQ